MYLGGTAVGGGTVAVTSGKGVRVGRAVSAGTAVASGVLVTTVGMLVGRASLGVQAVMSKRMMKMGKNRKWFMGCYLRKVTLDLFLK